MREVEKRNERIELLGVVNIDFAFIRVGDCRESLLREVDGGLASGRGAAIHHLDGHTSGLARVSHAGVGPADAPDPVHPPACLPVVPDCVACCCDHRSLVFIPIAR